MFCPKANGDLVSPLQEQQSAVAGGVRAVRRRVVIGSGDALFIFKQAHTHVCVAVAINVEVERVDTFHRCSEDALE